MKFKLSVRHHAINIWGSFLIFRQIMERDIQGEDSYHLLMPIENRIYEVHR